MLLYAALLLLALLPVGLFRLAPILMRQAHRPLNPLCPPVAALCFCCVCCLACLPGTLISCFWPAWGVCSLFPFSCSCPGPRLWSFVLSTSTPAFAEGILLLLCEIELRCSNTRPDPGSIPGERIDVFGWGSAAFLAGCSAVAAILVGYC